MSYNNRSPARAQDNDSGTEDDEFGAENKKDQAKALKA